MRWVSHSCLWQRYRMINICGARKSRVRMSSHETPHDDKDVRSRMELVVGRTPAVVLIQQYVPYPLDLRRRQKPSSSVPIILQYFPPFQVEYFLLSNVATQPTVRSKTPCFMITGVDMMTVQASPYLSKMISNECLLGGKMLTSPTDANRD